MRRNTLYFSLFFLISSMALIFAFIPQAAAIDETNLDRFFVVTSEAQGKGAIGSEVSSVGVSNFRNLGLYGHTPDALVYWASVRLNVIANVWTLAEIQSVEYMDRSIQWLQVYTHSCTWNKLDYAGWSYSATSHDISSYTVSDAQVAGLKLNIEYVPPEAKQLAFAGQNVTATLPVTTFQFDRYVVENATYGEIAAYTDRYANLRDAASGLSVINVGRPEDAQMGDALNAWNEKVKALELGVVAGSVVEGLTPDPLKVGKIIKPSAGSTRFVKDGPSASFTVPVSITPRVTEARQFVSIRDAAVWVDTVSDNFFFACGTAWVEQVSPVSNAKSFTRTVGAHVDNYYVQTGLYVDGYVFSSVQLSVPLTETFLAEPSVVKGDYVWDLTLGGATDVDLGFTTAQNVVADWLTEWLSILPALGWQIIGLIAIVIVIIVLVKAGPSIASFLARKVQSRARRE